MNRKQMIVLWIMALLLSLTAFLAGIDAKDPFLAIWVPVILLGTLVLYQVRDRTMESKTPTQMQKPLLVVIGLLLLQSLIMLNQQRSIRKELTEIKVITSSVDDIQSDVRDIQSDVSTIQTDVSTIESNTSALQ